MKHKLTLEEKLKGVKAALASERTPKQFLPSLERRAKQLQQELSARVSE